MTLGAKLNIVLDELVGQYQYKLGSNWPITHMYPFISAVLEINGITTTSNI